MRLYLIVILMSLITNLSAQNTIRPKALSPGDTIAIVTPARGIDMEKRDYVKKGLEDMGYKVKLAPNLLEEYGYLAGTDEVRARALMEMWTDPEVDAIFCATGGYGVTRILDRLDYDQIRLHPKIVTGFSDITALHLAIYKKTGLVTFHSPTTSHALANNTEEREFQAKNLWRAIAAESYKKKADGTFEEGYTIPADSSSSPPRAMVPGVARGTLVGGNLSLVAALMGTPYEVQTQDAILFLEDVGEEPYRIDRMLSTLEMSGKLDTPAGVVLGQFARCEPQHPESSLSLGQVFERYFAGRSYPVMLDFPVGHVIENTTLPIGVKAEMDTGAGVIRLLENPVVP